MFGQLPEKHSIADLSWHKAAGCEALAKLPDSLANSMTNHVILKNLEAMGYVRRQRDPKDERQVRISLTDAGRRLREKALPMNLVKETGLAPDDFAKMQKGVVALRDNLVRVTKGGAK